MTKKVAILTQPLHDNYGGLLQAFALKETLKSMGLQPIIINRRSLGARLYRQKISRIKNFLLNKEIGINKNLSQEQKKIISKHTKLFQETYIPELGKLITNQKGMQKLNQEGIYAYIVGSDQCWRPRYSPLITNYFLDFVKQNEHAKKISYAASFGTSEWEFDQQTTEKCSLLLHQFDAISVREDSAVELIKNHLGRDDAIHVLDPTMLLNKEVYKEIVKKQNPETPNGNLKVYVLDKSSEKQTIIDYVAGSLNLRQFEVMPKKRLKDELVTQENINQFQYPCPSEWLHGFETGEFVITDSFHGTVFSILNNKPFISLGNVNRGMSRFTSVLQMFGLEDRLLTNTSKESINKILRNEINWDSVNATLKLEKEKSINFLRQGLGL